MKNFIVTVASLILLIVFPVQIALDEVNHKRMRKFDEIVHVSTETARTDGRFTQDNIKSLKEDIVKTFDISEKEITINVTTVQKFKADEDDEREHINYEITVPIKKIIAANTMFNISDADNKVNYTLKGYVLSEVLMP